ncbi:hypothetical protein [Pseudomonas frederiksbergensis]|uniref:hypothetical protein n=1 Tax=Pseudomonas frederiksbergensis TaxID=104087 RepID=UPI000F485E61|nr:hypothetical protein [Pseudomonas frederiksbergensis]RON45446.1 hypothetical protein BK667_25300 [Pseudomonas frederiksbergensis]
MTLETEDKDKDKEEDSSGVPYLNDPGNEDPGSLMDNATVPLNDSDNAGNVGNTEYEEEDADED